MDDATPRPGDPFAAVFGCALAVNHIILTNFRSYARGELSAGSCPVVLAGANGTGKTNLLEAISLLSPGRGLRAPQIQRSTG
jgi:DNA replication and repair protein RecF